MVARKVRNSPHYTAEKAGAWTVKAGEAILKHNIVYVSSASAAQMTVKLAAFDALANLTQTLFIALEDIPSGEVGQVAPRALIPLAQAGAIGDRVIIGIASAPTGLSMANQALLSGLEHVIVIGKVVGGTTGDLIALVDPGNARILENSSAPGLFGAMERSPMQLGLMQLVQNTTNLDVDIGFTVVGGWWIKTDGAGDGTEVIKLIRNQATDNETLCSFSPDASGADGTVTWIDNLDLGGAFTAGDTIRMDVTANTGDAAGTFYLLTRPNTP